ncbi:MAG: alkaline phosphatase D family protein [Saprospiraceae bacterium]|nr:alkaline phosphatase D family protein [Saprospiraceae bacterium]
MKWYLCFVVLFWFSCSAQKVVQQKDSKNLIHHVIAGAVGTESVTLSVQTTAETSVLIVVRESDGGKVVFEKTITTQLSKNNIIKTNIVGLKPDTKYQYTLSGNKKEVWVEGRFTTFPDKAASYKVVFGSCQQTGSESPVFSQMLKENPLFYLQIGDLHYENIDDRCETRFDSAYQKVFSSKAQTALYRTIPLVYMWDDHDFGPNNSDSGNPCRTTAIRQYKNYFPHYPMAFDGETLPISQVFEVGRVTYVLCDMRSQKVPPTYDGCTQLTTGTNFGNDNHLNWFFNALLTAKKKGHVVFWINSYPWINTPGSPNYKCGEKDNWGGYPEERTRIADFIKTNEIPLCILSGDAHMVAIDDGSHSDYATDGGAPINVFHAAAIDRPGSYKGGPYSQGYSREEGQFGVIEVKDEGGKNICFVWYAKNAAGNPVMNQEGKEIRLEFCVTP